MRIKDTIFTGLLLSTTLPLHAMDGQHLWENYAQKDPKEVLIEVKNVLQDSPEDVQARLLLVRIYSDLNQFQRALDEIKKLEKLSNKTFQWALIGAKAHIGLQNLSEAQTLLVENLANLNGNEKLEANLLLVDIAFLRNEPQEAKQYIEEAEKNFPNTFMVSLAKIKYYLYTKDFEKTGEWIEKSQSKLSEGSKEALAKYHLYRAEWLRAQQDLEGAQQAYEQALGHNRYGAALLGYASLLLSQKNMHAFGDIVAELNQSLPHHPRVMYYTAVNLLQNNQREDAKTILAKAKELHPDFLPTYVVLARLHYEENNIELADSLLSFVLSKEKPSSVTAKLYAGIKLRLNEPKMALSILKPFLNEDTQDVGIKSLYANALMRVKQINEGIDVLNQAALNAPNHPIINTELALAYLHKGASDKAQAVLENIDFSDPRLLPAELLLAVTMLHNKDYVGALELSKKLNENYPNKAVTNNLMALSHWALGDQQEAEEGFVQAIKYDSNFIPAYNNLAALYLSSGNNPQAQKYLDQAIAINPNHLRSLILSAQLAEHEGRLKDARSWYRKALERNGQQTSPGLHLVSFYIRNGDFTRAYDQIKELASMFPEDIRVINVLAEMHYRFGDYSQALDAFTRLKGLVPKQAFVHIGIAKAALSLQDFLLANRAINDAVAIDSSLFSAHALKAYIAYEQKHYADAQKISNQILKTYPKEDFGYKMLGMIAKNQNQHEQALVYFKQAFKLKPSMQNLKLNYQTLTALNHNQEGFLLLEDWLGKHPENTSVRRLLATDYLLARENDKAKKHFEKILAMQPKDAIVLNNLANIYLNENKTVALDYAHKAYKLVPDHPFVADTFAWALIQNGKVKKALPILESALQASPDQDEVRLHYAYGLHEIGDISGASEQLKKCKQIPVNYQELYDTLEKKLGNVRG